MSGERDVGGQPIWLRLQRWLLTVHHPSQDVRRRGQALNLLLAVFAVTAGLGLPMLIGLLPPVAREVYGYSGISLVLVYLLGILVSRTGLVDLTGVVVGVYASCVVVIGASQTGVLEPVGWLVGLAVLIAGYGVRPPLILLVYAIAQTNLTWAKWLVSDDLVSMFTDANFGYMSFLLLVFAVTTFIQARWLEQLFSGQLRAQELALQSRDEAQEAQREAVEARDRAQRAQELAEHANRSKSRFLANVSHELRTPLNAIIGYSEMLDETHDEAQDPDLIQDLGKIRHAGRHLLSLINEVLDLAKVEAGRLSLELASFEIADVLRETLDAVAPSAGRAGNRLHLDVAPDLGAATSDRTRFGQIVLNLVSNAVKFTHDGDVYVRAARIVDEGNEHVQVEVQDTGIGIPGDRLARIFEAFEQADASTTRRYGGTGLGLAVSEMLAQALEGGITVESEVGRGSTFTVRIAATHSRSKGSDTAPPPEPRTAGAPRPLHVVVVHDDEEAREQVLEVLSRIGFRAAGAATPEEGRALLQAAPRGVVTSDRGGPPSSKPS